MSTLFLFPHHQQGSGEYSWKECQKKLRGGTIRQSHQHTLNWSDHPIYGLSKVPSSWNYFLLQLLLLLLCNLHPRNLFCHHTKTNTIKQIHFAISTEERDHWPKPRLFSPNLWMWLRNRQSTTNFVDTRQSVPTLLVRDRVRWIFISCLLN